MIKSKAQVSILIIGLISAILGVLTMLQTPTVIIPAWYLVLIFLPIIFLISLGLGFLVKKLSKSKWHSLTFASIVMTVLCLTFYISEYKTRIEILIPENYVGKVRLVVSNEKTNDLKINAFGIGYINSKTFQEGFMPIIIKGDQNITKEIKRYSSGGYSGTSESGDISFDYLSFEVSGSSTAAIATIDDLIKLNAIDTTRLFKK